MFRHFKKCAIIATMPRSVALPRSNLATIPIINHDRKDGSVHNTNTTAPANIPKINFEPKKEISRFSFESNGIISRNVKELNAALHDLVHNIRLLGTNLSNGSNSTKSSNAKSNNVELSDAKTNDVHSPNSIQAMEIFINRITYTFVCFVACCVIMFVANKIGGIILVVMLLPLTLAL